MAVYRFLQWRPLYDDGAGLHPLHQVSHRVLVVLDRTPLSIRRTCRREGPCQACHARDEVVHQHAQAAIRQSQREAW
jgi:hypothetical protein